MILYSAVYGFKQNVIHLSDNPKMQGFWATWTTVFGLGTVLDYIPGVLGMAGTFMGLLLTWVMIRKGWLSSKKLKLEIVMMEEQRRRDNESN